MEPAPPETTDSACLQVLVAEDQPAILEALRLLLKNEGYRTVGVTSPVAVLTRLASEKYDLLLLDLNYTRDTTSGSEGLELLSHLQALESAPPVVVMTAWGSIELAVEAMQRGACDFILKPWDNARLLSILRQQIERNRTLRHGRRGLEFEWEEVREIQQHLLPSAIPQIPGYELAVAWQPVGAVGGDYFDVKKHSETSVGLCIADVAGKGMPAALLMSNLQAAVKAFAPDAIPPREVCRKVNEIVCENVAAGKFITFFFGRLDAKAKRLVYSNAGHNPPLVLRRDGSLARLTRGGAVLGEFPDGEYEQGEVMLHPGERLVFFTDGITEARNQEGEEFGEMRLAAELARNRHLGAEALQKRLLEVVNAHCEGELQDDATLIVIAVK